MSAGSAGRTSGVMARTGHAVGAQGEALGGQEAGSEPGWAPQLLAGSSVGTAVAASLWSVFHLFCTCCFPKSVGAP